MTVYHYWVGNITGYVFSTGDTCPLTKPPDRLKYMGTTTDVMWPKKMSTGRLLFKPMNKSFRKQNRRKKLN